MGDVEEGQFDEAEDLTYVMLVTYYCFLVWKQTTHGLVWLCCPSFVDIVRYLRRGKYEPRTVFLHSSIYSHFLCGSRRWHHHAAFTRHLGPLNYFFFFYIYGEFRVAPITVTVGVSGQYCCTTCVHDVCVEWIQTIPFLYSSSHVCFCPYLSWSKFCLPSLTAC